MPVYLRNKRLNLALAATLLISQVSHAGLRESFANLFCERERAYRAQVAQGGTEPSADADNKNWFLTQDGRRIRLPDFGASTLQPFRQLAQDIQQAAANPEINARTESALKPALERKNGPGYVALDTHEFFPPSVTSAMWALLKERGGAGGSLDTLAMRFGEEGTEPFNAYVKWITDRINASLPADEKVEPEDIRLRLNNSAMTEDTPIHADGSYVTAVMYLAGPGNVDSPGTRYQEPDRSGRYYTRDGLSAGAQARFSPDQAIQALKPSQTLVFSGRNRGAAHQDVWPTVHAAPAAWNNRIFFQVLFRRVRQP